MGLLWLLNYGARSAPQVRKEYYENLRQGFTLTIIFVALTFALTLVAWSGSANQGDGPQANKQEITPENDVPVLDLKEAEKAAPEQLKGRKRGQRLRQRIRIEELPAGAEPLPFSWHFWGRVPALPVEESNAIVLGKVTDRRAVLMDDKHGIYSEFSIKISEIFKDDLNGFFIDQVITTTRRGGAVRSFRQDSEIHDFFPRISTAG